MQAQAKDLALNQCDEIYTLGEKKHFASDNNSMNKNVDSDRENGEYKYEVHAREEKIESLISLTSQPKLTSKLPFPGCKLDLSTITTIDAPDFTARVASERFVLGVLSQFSS